MSKLPRGERLEREKKLVLTIVDLLDKFSDLVGALHVRDDDARGAGVQCRGEADLVVLGHADDDVGLAFRMVLGGLDGTIFCGEEDRSVSHFMLPADVACPG